MNSLYIPAVICAVMVFFAHPGFSHPGHDETLPPPVSQEVVMAKAKEGLAMLVKRKFKIGGGPLDAGWLNSGEGTVLKKGQGYYIITFTHPAEKKTVYLLMADYGEIYDLNFSGVFSGIQ